MLFVLYNLKSDVDLNNKQIFRSFYSEIGWHNNDCKNVGKYYEGINACQNRIMCLKNVQSLYQDNFVKYLIQFIPPVNNKNVQVVSVKFKM